MTGQDQVPGTVRRPARERFVARERPSEGVVVRRDMLSTSRSDGAATTDRRRVLAGDLPDWEPLPPGEQLVRRVPGRRP